ncbi:pentapeptide repeat-containing protein [Leptolyngbyaceae cyanobacterium CCMR0082]|uniref:Pentapeptide repeat-containing protein n=1 Tax=Adonisia turfae CCMR0082 TaxID=2304604 RepID=A0A6M0SF10_9CYAN|nr:pentapeptide repeat-containing protein [Adonisia turfae]NEZ67034.1 pentapeptide repeat-containing protein [Adonisia turfae CCMR0082]
MNHKSSSINRFLKRVAQNFDKWIGPVGFILGVTFAVTIGIPTGIDIYQNWQNLDPKDRSQAGITLIQTVATIVGGIAIFWNIVLSRRQLAASQEQNITERFSVAVEQLGHEQTAVRIGGIYSLERIAQDSPRDYWTVMEILAAFIRDRRNWVAWEDLPEEPKIEKDITPAIIVLGRCDRSRQPANSPIYLQSCDFRRCAFINDNFPDTLFHKSHFGQANLSGSNFKGSSFRRSNFTNANLKNADLSETNLTKAKLTGADVTHCNFQNADLSEADLSHAKGLTIEQVKSARNWQAAIYDDAFVAKLGIAANIPGHTQSAQGLET